tara:strand:+ start:9 stop:770 length:762 start_codon:yes stop_codon:yes gene_type:complete
MLKKLDYDWEYNVLGAINYKEYNGALRFFFDFVRENHDTIEGDIVEAGVFKGLSLIGMGLMLRELGSDKLVYGFDSFAGFPPVYAKEDELESFGELYAAGKISKNHYEMTKRNFLVRQALAGEEQTARNLSSSGDFSGTSRMLVEKKIELLGLNNVVLIDGPFQKTMVPENGPKKVMAALMDCDLYHSYLTSFSYLWPKMSMGGLVYLDEYFSLKFPGGRIATDEFLAGRPEASLIKFHERDGEFERWGVLKQ